MFSKSKKSEKTPVRVERIGKTIRVFATEGNEKKAYELYKMAEKRGKAEFVYKTDRVTFVLGKKPRIAYGTSSEVVEETLMRLESVLSDPEDLRKFYESCGEITPVKVFRDIHWTVSRDIGNDGNNGIDSQHSDEKWLKIVRKYKKIKEDAEKAPVLFFQALDGLEQELPDEYEVVELNGKAYLIDTEDKYDNGLYLTEDGKLLPVFLPEHASDERWNETMDVTGETLGVVVAGGIRPKEIPLTEKKVGGISWLRPEERDTGQLYVDKKRFKRFLREIKKLKDVYNKSDSLTRSINLLKQSYRLQRPMLNLTPGWSCFFGNPFFIMSTNESRASPSQFHTPWYAGWKGIGLLTLLGLGAVFGAIYISTRNGQKQIPENSRPIITGYGVSPNVINMSDYATVYLSGRDNTTARTYTPTEKMSAYFTLQFPNGSAFVLPMSYNGSHFIRALGGTVEGTHTIANFTLDDGQLSTTARGPLYLVVNYPPRQKFIDSFAAEGIAAEFAAAVYDELKPLVSELYPDRWDAMRAVLTFAQKNGSLPIDKNALGILSKAAYASDLSDRGMLVANVSRACNRLGITSLTPQQAWYLNNLTRFYSKPPSAVYGAVIKNITDAIGRRPILVKDFKGNEFVFIDLKNNFTLSMYDMLTQFGRDRPIAVEQYPYTTNVYMRKLREILLWQRSPYTAYVHENITLPNWDWHYGLWQRNESQLPPMERMQGFMSNLTDAEYVIGEMLFSPFLSFVPEERVGNVTFNNSFERYAYNIKKMPERRAYVLWVLNHPESKEYKKSLWWWNDLIETYRKTMGFKNSAGLFKLYNRTMWENGTQRIRNLMLTHGLATHILIDKMRSAIEDRIYLGYLYAKSLGDYLGEVYAHEITDPYFSHETVGIPLDAYTENILTNTYPNERLLLALGMIHVYQKPEADGTKGVYYYILKDGKFEHIYIYKKS